MAYVISDEGAYRLGLVLLFGNGLYLPLYLQKSHVFSDEGVYKLGLVLLFRYGLWLMLVNIIPWNPWKTPI